MSFSGTIKIVDIDDYIKPAQECIKPLMEASKSSKGQKIDISSDDIKQKTKVDLVQLYNQAGQVKPDLIKKSSENTAKITLNDCLACSGCVTTAESILIEQHSITDFLDKVKKYKCSVVTISPQARSSLSVHFKMNDLQVHLSLLIFFTKLGAHYFFDQSFGVDLAQAEAQKEFLQKLIEYENGNKSTLPLLCSECPGWVCYAEKVVRADAISHMSKVKSPQQIIGNLLKEHFSKKADIERGDIYHLSIQPCYDKKLEATRKEFERDMVKEVDTVITAGEVVDLIKKAQEEKMIDIEFENLISHFQAETLLQNLQPSLHLEEYLFESASKSGLMNSKLKTNSFEKNNSHSYLESIIRAAVREYYRADNSQISLNYKNGKNQDIEECIVSIDGKEAFTTARIYGFRNIQLIQRQLKTKNSKYLYVEIMACPSGCVNGGGQTRMGDKEMKSKDIAKAILHAMNDQSVKDVLLPEENKYIEMAKQVSNFSMYTEFQAVDDDTFSASKLKW